MARLSTERRKEIPKGEFGVPSKAPGPGSYPMPDRAHAANAKARDAQHASPAVKAQVDRKANAILGKHPRDGSREKLPPHPHRNLGDYLHSKKGM